MARTEHEAVQHQAKGVEIILRRPKAARVSDRAPGRENGLIGIKLICSDAENQVGAPQARGLPPGIAQGRLPLSCGPEVVEGYYNEKDR